MANSKDNLMLAAVKAQARLTPRAFTALLALVNAAEWAGGKWACKATYADIATACGLSPKSRHTVADIIKELEDKNMMCRKQGQTCCTYNLKIKNGESTSTVPVGEQSTVPVGEHWDSDAKPENPALFFKVKQQLRGLNCCWSGVSEEETKMAQTDSDTTEPNRNRSKDSNREPNHSDDHPSDPTSPDDPNVLRGLILYEGNQPLRRRWAELYQAWRMAYPRLDILAAVKEAHAWEVSHPRQRKKNKSQYLNTWLKRAHKELPPEGPKKRYITPGMSEAERFGSSTPLTDIKRAAPNGPRRRRTKDRQEGSA